MADQEPLPNRQYNGRTVVQGVDWWAKHTDVKDHDKFFCIHKVPLSKSCKECNA